MTSLLQFCQRNFKGFIQAFHKEIIIVYGDYKEFEKCFIMPEFGSLKEGLRNYHENVGKKTPQRDEIQTKPEQEHDLEQHIKKIPDHVFLKWLLSTEIYNTKIKHYMEGWQIILAAMFSDLSIDAFEILLKHKNGDVDNLMRVLLGRVEEQNQCVKIGDDLLQKTKVKHLLKCFDVAGAEYGFFSFCDYLSLYPSNKFLMIFCEVFLGWLGSDCINKVHTQNQKNILEMTYYMPGDTSQHILMLLLKHDNLSLVNIKTGTHILPYLYQHRNTNDNTKSNFDHFFKTLLQHKDLDINGTCHGSTALMKAATVTSEHFDANKIKMLLNHRGIDIAVTNSKGETALHLFMKTRKEDIELLTLFLHKIGSGVNAADIVGNTALHYCVKHNSLSMFNQFMQFHEDTKLVDLNARDNEECTPIMLAECTEKEVPTVPQSKEDWARFCKEVKEAVGNCILAELMQNENVEKNLKNKKGLTVLQMIGEDILFCGEHYKLKWLFWVISNTSEDFINAEDEKGMSFLSHIVQDLDNEDPSIEQKCAVVKNLFQVLKFHPTFNVNSKDKEGKTVLMHVIIHYCNSKSSLLKVLLECADININQCDDQGCTPLMYAARTGILECIELVSSHPDVNGNLLDRKDYTALQYALKEITNKSKQIKIIKILINNLDLENVNCKDTDDFTVLHILLQHKEFSTIIILLSKMEKHATGLIDFAEKTSSRKDVWDSLLETLNECKEEPTRTELQNILKLALSLPNTMVNKTYQDKRTVLHKAALLCCSSAWNQFLEESSIDINLQDDFGNTALMYAVRKLPWQDIKSFLCKFPQIDISLHNNKGETLLDIIDGSKECDLVKKGLVEVAVSTQKYLSSSPDALLHQVGLPRQFECLKKGIGLDKSIDPQRKGVAVKLLTQCEKELDANKDSSYGEFYSMPEIERTKLQMLHTELLSELEINPIVSYLYAKQVITGDMLDEIKCQKKRSKKCEKLLLILPHRGKKAYGYFLEALRHESVNQPHLAEMIEEFEPDKDFSLSSTSDDDDGVLAVYQRQNDIPIPNFVTDGKVVYVTNYITQNFHGKPPTE